MTATHAPTTPRRHRLPDRRPAVTRAVIVDGREVVVSIGYDPVTAQPAEVFLSGAKEGSAVQSLLDDATVVLSVALQHGVPAAALARSIARQPGRPLAPPYIDIPADPAQPRPPATIIGAALDALVAAEEESRP